MKALLLAPVTISTFASCYVLGVMKRCWPIDNPKEIEISFPLAIFLLVVFVGIISLAKPRRSANKGPQITVPQ